MAYDMIFQDIPRRVWLVPRLHGGTFASVHVSDGMSGAVNAVSMLEDESMPGSK